LTLDKRCHFQSFDQNSCTSHIYTSLYNTLYNVFSNIYFLRINNNFYYEASPSLLARQLVKKKQKKELPKEGDEAFEHYFLYIPRGILLLIHGNVVHSVVSALGRMVWKRKPITICISIVAPMMPLKQMWIKEETTTCWMTGTAMLRISCMSCRILSLTNTELLPSEREWLSICSRVWNIYFRIKNNYIYIFSEMLIYYIAYPNMKCIFCHY